MKLRHPPTLADVRVLERASWKRYAVGAVLVALYSISINFYAQTVGQPYEWALEEQKRTVREKANATREKGVSFQSGKQDRKETQLEVDYESLPSQLLPGAWTCALIFLTASCHALFHLLCVWSIAFKANMLFQPTKRVRPGVFVRCTPHKHKGKPDICPLDESEITLKYVFTFQYQSYEYVEAEDADEDDAIDGKGTGVGAVRMIQCPVNLKWSEYRSSTGLKTESEVEKAQDMYGANIFDLPRPTFLQLFKKQLVSPIAVFQFFCTGLWMLDTYWKYTCFTLLSLIGFEASTAFQRLKSMSTLRGMSTKSYPVWVYRTGCWKERPIEELLPGDIVSISSKKATEKEAVERTDSNGKAQGPEQNDLTVPCDCILLRGSAIVNEATLTGESVPQMKDALSMNADEDAHVDIFGKHRIHALFSGTSLIQATPAQRSLTNSGEGDKSGPVPDPPNDGVLCFVLRTGFNSSQGELMRMIEFSTDDVSADKVETCLQLLFLLMFALAAAGYVLKKGLEDETRPTYKTLLRCTLIITNVVPPSLPMQMAFAVHTALMALLKSGIFCTEPFRVPFAGKVSHCFFDKTGTLTSDHMVAVGIVNAEGGKKGGKGEQLTMKDVSTIAAAIVGGCHSLIEVDGKAIGDPIEVAALKGVGWSYIPSTSTASPGRWRAKELNIAKQKQYLGTLRDDLEADKKEKEELVKKLEDVEKSLKTERAEAKKLQVTIEQRFHFSSDLQRMSTICRVVSSGSSGVASGSYCFSKGSPEAIGKLLTSKPEWYDATYQKLAEQGQRVLALAYRHFGNDNAIAKEMAQKPRDASEQDLTFAGLISFKCETRKDSELVIRSLLDSKHQCVMLTGDAPLTALSVAQEVGLCRLPASKALILSAKDDSSLEWRQAIMSSKDKVDPVPFRPEDMPSLSQEHDLVITGSSLEQALSGNDADAVSANLASVVVFARVSPWQKEQVIQAAKAVIGKDATLMCGDGGNDVGALKEADVGLALLSGFGNANVGGTDGEEGKDKKTEALATMDKKSAEDELAEQRSEVTKRAQQMNKKANEELARRRKDLMSKQQQWIEEELAARRERGEDVGFMGQMGAMKSVMNKLKTEMKSEQEALQKKHGNAFAAGAAKWAGEMDNMEDTPMVKLGDASTAAPFTTRMPSISSCVDIVRQGRCTLLSSVQQMEIMMLESMISAYTMSTMSVDGTRPSEPQMMASGTLMSVASLAFSFARPLDRMHPVRPLQSVFHPAILFSMLGQLAIHLCCMVYMAQFAKDIMGEEAVKEIIEFEKDREKKLAELPEEAMNEFAWFTSVPFKSNLLNTCCWLIETSQQVAVIFVNYKGRPWMKGILENQPLFLSLILCTALVAICAWGAIPQLNTLLNLEVLPEELRPTVMIVLFVSLIGSLLWDRLMVFIFARHIHDAQLEEVKATTLADFVPLLKTVGYTGGGLLVLLTGNPLLLGLAYMMYRNYMKSNWQEPAAGGARPA